MDRCHPGRNGHRAVRRPQPSQGEEGVEGGVVEGFGIEPGCRGGKARIDNNGPCGLGGTYRFPQGDKEVADRVGRGRTEGQVQRRVRPAEGQLGLNEPPSIEHLVRDGVDVTGVIGPERQQRRIRFDDNVNTVDRRHPAAASRVA